MGKAHDEHTWVATYAVYTKKKQLPQTTSFKAFMAKHFTTVRAALAFTFTSLPNIMRLPALVAGLYLVLTMQMPGSVNFPVLFVSFVATSARASNTLDISDLFASHAAAKASAMAPLLIDFTPFLARMAFMAFIAFIAFLAIAS